MLAIPKSIFRHSVVTNKNVLRNSLSSLEINYRSYGNVNKDKLTNESSSDRDTKRNPDLPDYNTTVDVDSHKLTRPTARVPTRRWTGLDDLAERTKVS